jgi:hypothetical protein
VKGAAVIKQKVVFILIVVFMLASLVVPAAGAADPVLFSAANDEIMPLKTETMPKYFGNTLYLPFTFFSSDSLGVQFTNSSDLNAIMIYATPQKWLQFDVSQSTIFDQDNQQYYYRFIASGGTIYLPVKEICDFFGFTSAVITVYPGATIIRIKNDSAAFNDASFPYNPQTKSDMQKYYDEYKAANTPPNPSVSPSPGVSPSPVIPPAASYERVTVYLSFYQLSGEPFGKVLDLLRDSGYRCSFFIAADEIPDNADLLRRAAGEGHTIGIWLKTGQYSEYLEAAGLLYEAAKLRTLLVAAAGTAAGEAEAAAEAHGLIYWRFIRRYDAAPALSTITSKLSVLDGSRDSIGFACTTASLHTINSLLDYLKEKAYNVRRIIETNKPPISINQVS